ncbi:RC3H1 [Cordylochernes scorpioides]|uniref:RC3H1 n=1 Tax=Cordylochernes scorpioides TaxID=51811 RepID=A0ABY6KX80_9ARAC|nr:RC3H1 [Cordylochernes scorpioides]
MPVQSPQWSEFLSCPICYNEFEGTVRCPISLGCGHTLCRHCLAKLQRKQCPFDQTAISTDISQLPVNSALLQLVSSPSPSPSDKAYPDSVPKDQIQHYLAAKKCIEELALYLKTSLLPRLGTDKGEVTSNS